MAWVGAVSGALQSTNGFTSITADIGYDSRKGITSVVSRVLYDNQENLELSLDVNYQPFNCSTLSTGAGRIRLYGVGDEALIITVDAKYNPCPSTITDHPIWEIVGSASGSWRINSDITLNSAYMHLIGEQTGFNILYYV